MSVSQKAEELYAQADRRGLGPSDFAAVIEVVSPGR